jgi:hypothetical protein
MRATFCPITAVSVGAGRTNRAARPRPAETPAAAVVARRARPLVNSRSHVLGHLAQEHQPSPRPTSSVSTNGESMKSAARSASMITGNIAPVGSTGASSPCPAAARRSCSRMPSERQQQAGHEVITPPPGVVGTGMAVVAAALRLLVLFAATGGASAGISACAARAPGQGYERGVGESRGAWLRWQCQSGFRRSGPAPPPLDRSSATGRERRAAPPPRPARRGQRARGR